MWSALLAALVLVVLPSAASAAYEVGTATRAINPTQDEIAGNRVFLGGYGISGLPGVGRSATGVLGEGASTRAFVISDGDGGELAVANIEVQGWFVATKDGPYGLVDMRHAIEKATGGELDAEEVVIQSDHSHGGMDAMGIWGGIPDSVRRRIFERTVAAVVQAWETRREAAQVVYGRADGADLLSNQYSDDPDNQTMDNELRVLQARDAEGQPFATFMNFSAHTTVLGSSNTKITGDWVQRVNPLLEQAVGGEVVTAVGTLGRSQPADRGCQDDLVIGDEARSLCALDEYAGRVVARAQQAIAGATPLTGDPVVESRTYLIQDMATNAVLLSLLAAGDAVQAGANRSIAPPWLTGNVLGTVSGVARIGNVLVASMPGEAYPQIPQTVRDLVGPEHPLMTLGLANDQLGYLIAPFPDSYAEPICRTFFGECPDTLPDGLIPDPIANDNYAFNVSHTMGERVICSLLRGAGEVLHDGDGARYRDRYEKCALFANDAALPHGADVGRSDASVAEAGNSDAPWATQWTGNGGEGQVRAGAAKVRAAAKVGHSAGQYSSIHDPSGPVDPQLQQVKNAPSYGMQSELEDRALVVEGADGGRVAIVKSDLYIPQDLLYRRTAQLLEAKPELGIGRHNLTMTVTHDHSSPYYSSTGWGAWAFQDVLDVRFYEESAQRMAAAVEKAARNLVPVRVGAAVGYHDKTSRNPIGPGTADDGTRSGFPQRHTDHDLTVIRFDDVSGPEPKPLANLVNFSLHPEFLGGNDLISGDYVAPLQRMLDRETGAITVYTQGAVGTGEIEQSSYHDEHERLEFNHREYAQAEFGARLLADSAKAVWRDIAAGTPEDPKRYVPFTESMPVSMGDRWYPGPLSHPYPGVSSCRTDEALAGNPRIPVIGLPDCQDSVGEIVPLEDMVPEQSHTDTFQQYGIPVPENYSAPSYTGLEEDLGVHLQVMRLGDILLTICSCEQWIEQSENIESRTDTIRDDRVDESGCGDPGTLDPIVARDPDAIFKGWLWPELCAADTPAERKARAQVLNDAVGWDFVENVAYAESEAADPDDIKGNFTHEELAPDLGYKLTVPIGMANDYNGYIASYREYQRGDHYRKALTGWGPHSSDYIATRLVELAGHLKQRGGHVLPTEPQRALADHIGSVKIPADLAHNDARAQAIGAAGQAAIEATEAKAIEDPGAGEVVDQPEDIERFDGALFTWKGGNNFVDVPVVRVERRVGDRWREYADQSGEVPVTLRLPEPDELPAVAAGSFEYHWSAHFEAFVAPFDPGGNTEATPPGDYRFVVDGHRRSGGATVPYRVASRVFKVAPWDGVEAGGLREDADGRLSFAVGPERRIEIPAAMKDLKGRTGTADVTATIGPIDYPDTYDSPTRFIRDGRSEGIGGREFIRDPDARDAEELFEWFCFTCSFRPWRDVGGVASAEITIRRADGSAETVSAHLEDGRYVADRELAPGETAFVAPGGVRDPWGNHNGVASNEVSAPAAGPDPDPDPSPSPSPDPGDTGVGGADGTGGTEGSAGSDTSTPPSDQVTPVFTPAPPAPAACVDTRRPRVKVKRRTRRAVRGTASDRGCAGLSHVEVAIRRNGAWRWVRAKGAERWKVRVRRRAKVVVRAVDRAGNLSR